MEIEKLDCPTIGLIYTKVIADTITYYALEPDDMHKMRVQSMDTEDDERNAVPCYLHRIAIPRPYDFEKNEMGIESETIE